MFPVIKHLDDVLSVVGGNKNIGVYQKEGYIVADYILNTPDLFNHPIEKECRGIIFDATTGALLRRPLHKFFNLNERLESSVANVDLSRPHNILEKLDGSMISPFYVNGRLIWGSKAGETFLTPQIEAFVANKPLYRMFAEEYTQNGYTLVFEWCSCQNRIVIDYPNDKLVLTAIRKNDTGEYVTYHDMFSIAKIREIDVVGNFGNVKNSFSLSLDEYAEVVKQEKDCEGYVIRFDDGFMLKMKTDEYVRQHRAKDDINMEKNVVSILVNNEADDFRTLLSANDRARFEKFEGHFFDGLMGTAQQWSKGIAEIRAKWTRKEFALKVQSKECELHPPLPSIVFRFWDEKDVSIQAVYYELLNRIKRSCGSQADIDKVRILWLGCEWKNY